MNVSDLRAIGKRLFGELREVRRLPAMGTALGTGAGGDRTYLVDRKAEEIIISSLERLHEPLSVISEEAGIFELAGGGKKVIIDPIDGSRNAISGIPFYCASIAVASGDTIGDIGLSLVVNLINGDEFWAEKGGGAFLNGERIRTQEDDGFFLVAYEAQSPGRDIEKILPLLAKSRKTRCLGATALDLAYLAAGAVSVFVSPSPSRSFDFAGGLLLVREAGGIVTDTEGNDIDHIALGLKRSSPLLAACNAPLHQRAATLLRGPMQIA
jgi:myo-inositol-1(or 4)-monophosphatase